MPHCVSVQIQAVFVATVQFQNPVFIQTLVLCDAQKRLRTWPRWLLPLRTDASVALSALLHNIFGNCIKLDWVRPSAHSNINVKLGLRWKGRCLHCAVRQPRQMPPAHSPKPLIFPETNYPGVRDLTHTFRTAGGFSDFNHTSMPVPQSNLHCLSQSPGPFASSLSIMTQPQPLRCDLSLSVSLSVSPSSWQENKTAGGGLGSGEQSVRLMISS